MSGPEKKAPDGAQHLRLLLCEPLRIGIDPLRHAVQAQLEHSFPEIRRVFDDSWGSLHFNLNGEMEMSEPNTDEFLQRVNRLGSRTNLVPYAEHRFKIHTM